MANINNVDHLSHYADSCSLECIDVMKVVFGYEYTAVGCMFNVFKYMWRYKNKGKPKEDLDKAEWYRYMAWQCLQNTYNESLSDLYRRIDKLLIEVLKKNEDET